MLNFHVLFLWWLFNPLTTQHEQVPHLFPMQPIPKVELVNSSFVYTKAPFKSCHASSVVALGDGELLATWFGGTAEKNPDVTIWTSRFDGTSWQEIRQVADGIQTSDHRYPCWNPVLFKHSSGTLFLFYKVGPSPREWWGEMIESQDNGLTWTSPRKLKDDFLGPIRAKPKEMSNGDILCPSSIEYDQGNWKVHMEFFTPSESTWTRIDVDPETQYDVIQPTILDHGLEELQILCRSRQNRIIQSRSSDGGRSWGPLEATNLPNPSAGIDGITLSNGDHLLVYNPTENGPADRAKLMLSYSSDGSSWEEIYPLENHDKGEYSYPAIIQDEEGLVHVTYTWQRERIKHVVLKLTY